MTWLLVQKSAPPAVSFANAVVARSFHWSRLFHNARNRRCR